MLLISVFVLFGLIVVILFVCGLDIVVFGYDVGKVLGVNLLWIWIVFVVVVMLLVGIVIVVVGLISFFGLIVFYLVWFWVGVEYCCLLFYFMLFGVLLLLGVDLVGWLIGLNDEISVGIMVVLIGGLVFVLLVR